MGNDPTTSVVNANCQAHDVKNLLRRRRQSVRVAGRQEPDVDDSRAIVANERLHHRAAEGGVRYERRGKRGRGRRGTRDTTRSPTRRSLAATGAEGARRDARRGGARSAAADDTAHAWCHVAGAGKPARARLRARRGSSIAHEWKPRCAMLADYVIPRDDRSGSATRRQGPGVHGLSALPKKTRTSARRSRFAAASRWIDNEVPESDLQKTFIAAERRAAATDARRHRVSGRKPNRK